MMKFLLSVLLVCGIIAAIEVFVSFEVSKTTTTRTKLSSLRKQKDSDKEIKSHHAFSGDEVYLNQTMGRSNMSNHDIVKTQSTQPSLSPTLAVSSHGKDGSRSSVDAAADVQHLYSITANISKNDQNISQILTEVLSSTGVAFDGLKMRSFEGEKIIQKQFESQSSMSSKPALVSGYEQCLNWAVARTVSKPTKAIKRVADLPSWCLVIVADTDTPSNYMDLFHELNSEVIGKNVSNDRPLTSQEQPNHNVFLFTVEMQREWESTKGPLGSFVSHIPWMHISRKNLGYLFAILHGANFIFDFDDETYIKIDDESGKLLDILPPKHETTGMMKLTNVSIVSLGTSIYNHHMAMKGASNNETSWARGFPLDKILDSHTHGKIVFQKDVPLQSPMERQVGVIQYFADEKPDIDALHRLIAKPLPTTFDFGGENVHPVMVPKHAYAPYNSYATIHNKDAMWAMLLPSTVSGHVADIWRSYFAQCIFHDTSLRLVIAPSMIGRTNNDFDHSGDLEAEHDLYAKSGKLLDFLQNWDAPSAESVPERMETLWIDLYEHGYIELDDVYALQHWLGALKQIGYVFPPLKRRYRNVAVMGQFNYAHFPTQVDDVIFWVQKYREYFHSVIAAGPFSEKQVMELAGHSIEVIVGSLNGRKNGHYDPYENLMVALQHFKNSTTIEAVLYAHDDALVNVTDLSQGMYPFPTNNIIANTKLMERDEFSFGDPREAMISNDDNIKYWANATSYRMHPNGSVSTYDNLLSFKSFRDLYNNVLVKNWGMYLKAYCSGAQMMLTKDPESAKFLEKDGSMVFPSYSQADFLLVPTKYADFYTEAAKLHSKNNVFLECAMPKIVDMIRQQATTTTDEKVTVRVVKLCTTFHGKRGKPSMIQWCQSRRNGKDNTKQTFGILHPIKLNTIGYKAMDWIMDEIQS